MKGNRVLLTGVTGFIGEKLARSLADQGRIVHAIIRPNSALNPELPVIPHYHDGSVASMQRIVGSAQPHTVFHLASLYIAEHTAEQVVPLMDSNVAFPALLLDAMVTHGVTRFINTGTNWQHYNGPCYEPVNLYAATKQAFADILAFYCSAYDIKAVTLKLFDTYGAGDKRRKLVQLLVDVAMSGETLDMSPGDQIVDLTHVDDVCEAFVSADSWLDRMAMAGHNEFFISGERHTVKELAALVAATLKRPVHARFGERPYRAREMMAPADVDISDRLPNWSPRRRLESELLALIR